MTRRLIAASLAFLTLSAAGPIERSDPPANPRIDMESYLRVADEAAKHRESRRLTEAQFLRAMRERGVVVLDARSAEKYAELHIRGAVNLSFPDISIESLARVLPEKSTRVLIYCNNNFENAESAFPKKIASASLNLSTYIALYSYGYRNVYELGPVIDARHSKLPLESGAGGRGE